MQDRRAYVKWKEVFLLGHNDLANDTSDNHSLLGSKEPTLL